MKRLFCLTTLLLALSVSLSAQKALLHSGGNVQVFTGTDALVSAYNASAAGDTIYLSGHTFNTVEFYKTLVIYGAGHYPDSTQATGKTFINGNVHLREEADNFHIEGVEITGNLAFGNNESVNGLVVKYCKINGTVNVPGNLSNPSTNLALIGNVFNTLDIPNAENVLISNNIINALSNTNGNNISNNVFLWKAYAYVEYGGGENNHHIIIGNNNQIQNNIFIQPNRVWGNGNTFKNNIFKNSSQDFGLTPTITGNYTGISSETVFVNQMDNTFDYAHDYHLQSPATYLGTDGTQIGIYGGAFPYKEGAVPSNPHIESAVVTPVTDGDGKLNVQIKVRAEQ
jgi:hypothetical protein